MDIIISVNNNQKILIFPVVPPDIAIEDPSENETFDTIQNGKLKIFGNNGLRRVGIDSFFPTKPYPWIKRGASSNGWEYVEFFQTYKRKKMPMRIVITTKDGQERLNMACTCENFTHAVDKAGDIKYTLEFEEFPLVR